MVVKGKGKQKAIQAADAGVSQGKDDVELARNITKRLRKGQDLKPLRTEAEKLVLKSPSAVTLLCGAKLKLALAIEGFMSSGTLEFENRNRQIRQSDKDHLQEAIELSKRGALEHASLLCLKFHMKLMEIVNPGFDKLDLPRPQEFADPATELLEQGANLWEFETWGKEKDKDKDKDKDSKDKAKEKPSYTSEFKIGLLVELERLRMASFQKRRVSDGAFDYAEGIFYSGLLHESQKSHLRKVLNRRQTEAGAHEKQMTMNHRQIMQQLAAGGGHGIPNWEDFEQIHLAKQAEDEHTEKLTRAEELKKRNEHRKETEAQLRADWMEEVVVYVQRLIAKHTDNDARLAALHDLTSIPLDDLIDAYNTSDGDMSEKRRMLQALRSLTPAKGAINNSTMVFFEADSVVSEADVAPQMKDEFTRKILQEAEEPQDLRSIGIDPVAFISEVWDGTWVKWTGQIPSDMSPMSSIAVLNDHLHSAESAEYKPTPLDEPSEGLGCFIRHFVHDKISHDDPSASLIGNQDIVSSGRNLLLDILTKKKADAHWLPSLTAACMDNLAGGACGLQLDLHDQSSELHPNIDNQFQTSVTVTEVAALNEKPLELALRTRGQATVTLRQQLQSLDSREISQEQLQQLFETYKGSVNLEETEFRIESRLEGQLLSAADFAPVEAHSAANGNRGSDSSTTDGVGNGYSHSITEGVDAWWESAEQRFTTEELRAALLEEVRLAAATLLESSKFTVGIATAISAHINASLVSSLSVSGSKQMARQVMYLEHARLLDVQPLRALLHFLWTQLGFTWMFLPHNQKTEELVVCQSKSFYEFLDDGSVRYSAASLRHLACEQRSEEATQATQQAAENGAEEQKQARDGPESEVHEQQSAEQQQAQHAQQQQQQKFKEHVAQGCTAYNKLIVDDDYLRHFVKNVFVPMEPGEPEQEEEELEMGLQDTRAMIHNYDIALRHSVADAIAIAKKVGEVCAQLVYEIDACNTKHILPPRPPLSPRTLKVAQDSINPAVGRRGIEAVQRSMTMSAARYAAASLPFDLLIRSVEVKKAQQKRVRHFQGSIRGFHMNQLMNMGDHHVRDIDGIVKRSELYNESLMQMEGACFSLSDNLHIQSLQLSQKRRDQDKYLSEAGRAHNNVMMAVGCLNDLQQRVIAHMPDQAVVDMNGQTQDALDRAVATAVQSISTMAMHLDMLVLQIGWYHTLASESRCETIESTVFMHHVTLLRKRLVEAAKQSKEMTQKQVADQTMMDLLAVEEQSKSHLAEGAVKKSKKKKKASKQRGDKQEEAELQQQDPDTIAEDWENEVPLPPGLQNGNEANTRSPSPALSAPVKEDDYRRAMSGAYQEEDWSTVDKKKDRKVKAVTKPGEATAAAAIPSAWDAEEDGWEDAGPLLDSTPEASAVVATADAPTSSSDQNGQEAATSTGRSDSDVQCDKCGKWGHPAIRCTEEFCDRCQQKGHSIKNCKQRHQRDSARAGSEQERSREAQAVSDQQRLANIACHRCGQYGHRIRDCPIPDPRGAPQCFNCQQYGHMAAACPNPRPIPRAVKVLPIPAKTAPLTVSRRHADSKRDSQSATASQAGSADQDELRGKSGRRGLREQQSEGSSSTLPLPRSFKRGQPGRQGQQEQAADYPSLSSSSSNQPLPQGLPGAFTQPPPPPSSASGSTWGPSRLASQHDPRVSKPDPRSDRPRTPGWGQAESLVDQATGQTWDDDDDASYLSSSPPPRSPHRMGGPTDTLHPGSAWAPQSASVRPSSARSLALTDSSGASTSGRGHMAHMAMAPGMLQPGMSAPNQGWSAPGAPFGPHSSDPQIPHRLYEQLACPNDPVVSPGFAQRAAPARTHYDPAGPIRNFVNQETKGAAVMASAIKPASAEFDSEAFLSNLLNENQLDNRPVSDIYSAAPVGGSGADTAHWPGLADAPPAGPGAMSWAARVDVNADGLPVSEQEDDDEDLQKALQASLADDQSELKQAAYASELMRQGAEAGANGVSIVGLRNATGEYNCFLNVIIQCLWHCHDFRRQVMKWEPAAYEDNAVVTALIGLFKAFAEREKSKAASQAVDPTQLRVALGNLEGDKFKVGQMGDAAEVLGALYEKLAAVAAKAGNPTLLDDNFGLHVKENVHCHKCGKDTHQHSYVQYFYNVMSTSISVQGVLMAGQPLGQALKDIEGQSQKSCDTDKGGCNVPNAVQHILLSTPPCVFTMQLAWQSNNESADDIRQAMDGMKQELDLGDVYLHVPQHKHIYHIRSMVCYYGQHYLAFVLMPDHIWFMFDDASMQHVGDWASVIAKCAAGRTQASVFFFEQK